MCTPLCHGHLQLFITIVNFLRFVKSFPKGAFSATVFAIPSAIWQNCTNHILCHTILPLLFSPISCPFYLIVNIPSTIFLHSNFLISIVFPFRLWYICFINLYSLFPAGQKPGNCLPYSAAVLAFGVCSGCLYETAVPVLASFLLYIVSCHP